jgi:SAM-dependent methyltransferase
MSWVYKCLVLVSIVAALDAGAVEPAKSRGANIYQKVTGDDSEEDRARWDAIFNTKTYVYGEEPAVFLREHVDMLPVGRALDIAMGEGRNAVYLAKKGFRVVGVDISDVALRKARNLARKNKVTIETVRQDLQTYTIAPGAYDVILDINYLQRNLIL